MKLAEALARLRSSVEWKEVMGAADDMRPFLRAMNPNDNLDEQANKMLFLSGQQSGFDMLMNFLRGNEEWQNRNK